MSTISDDPLDDMFFGCALTAFLQVASEQRAMPDKEATRRRAYRLYEETLREKHSTPPIKPDP
jgi:hypothetical protein